MEIASHSPSPTLFQGVLFQAPTTYLSTKKVSGILQDKKKVVQFDPNLGSFNKTWQTIALSVVMVSLVVGFAVFLRLTNDSFVSDHSGDVVTPYRCAPQRNEYHGECERGSVRYEMNSDGYVLNHTNDHLFYSFSEGLKAWIPITLVPSVLVALVWKIWNLYLVGQQADRKKDADLLNERLDDKIMLLKNGLGISKKVVVPPEFILSLADLEYLKDYHYKVLSFNQIRSLKNHKFELFKTLLENKKFSEEQNGFWIKLEQLLAASLEKLTKALQNHSNHEVFEKEPRILEALIQELSKQYLTDTIKSILALKMGAIQEVFAGLQPKERIQIIELMAEHGYSFELGFRNFQVLSLKDEGAVTLKFLDENQNPLFIKAPKNLLSLTSVYFKNFFEDSNFNCQDDVVDLENVNPKYFNEIITYLTTGKFTLIEMTELLSLWDVANFLGIDDLLESIESYISTNLLSHHKKNALQELLKQSEESGLNAVPCAIDWKVSLGVSSKEMLSWFFSNEFLKDLSIMRKFSLNISLSQVAQGISSNIKELFKNKGFVAQFVQAIKINENLLKILFPSMILFFEKNPYLLKDLWDEAFSKKNEAVQDKILKLWDDPQYLDIVLANWTFPPKKSIAEMMTTQNSDEFIELEISEKEEI